MAEYIEREAAVAIIEEKQKELCPLGRYSRTMVYGSDRDRFDSWQEIINSIEAIPAADVVEVKHGRWIYNNMGGWHCSECNNQAPFWCMASTQNLSDYCPNCGAKMDGGTDDGKAD